MKRLILFVVTDGAHARLLEQRSKSESLYQVQNLTHTHESTHEHGTDKPGRVFERSFTAHHAYEPKTDWHDRQKEVFIKKVSNLIINMHEEKHYDKVFLMCPPKIIGILRACLNPYLDTLPSNKKICIVEVNKDLTNHTLKEIEEHISSQEFNPSSSR